MWFKVDDKLHDHDKARDTDLAAMGLWVMAGSWCGANSNDGFVPRGVVRRWGPRAPKLAGVLVSVGLWEVLDGRDGWQFHDWQDRNPLKEETTTDLGRVRWRRKNALSKDRGLCEAVVTRDRSQCRYCGERVNWLDRKGVRGGTYDHVDPDGPNSLLNVVVACRKCNGRKKDRTPDEAKMPLLPVPGAYQAPEPDKSSTGVGSDLAPPREAVRSQVGVGSESGSVSGRVPAANGSGGSGSSNGKGATNG